VQPTDYAALAKQSGAVSSTPAPASGPAQPTGGFWSNLMSHLHPVDDAAKLYQNVTDPHLPTGEFLKNWQTESQALKDKAEASAQQGDYVGAAAHGINFLANMVPGLGKAMDDAAEGIRDATTDEQVRAHLGRLAAIAAPLAIANAAPELKAGGTAVGKAAAGVVTKPGTGKILGGVGTATTGLAAMAEGTPVGLILGGEKLAKGASAIYKGFKDRAAAAEEARAAAASPEAAPPVAPGSLTIQPQAARPVAPAAPITAANYAPPVTSTNVLPAPIAPPAAAPAPAAAAPPAAAPPSIDLLNQTARNMGARSFSSLPPEAQDTVRAAVAKYNERSAAGEQTLARPAPTPQTAPAAQPAPTSPAPAPAAWKAGSSAPAATPPPTVTTIPAAKPAIPAQAFEDAARTAKAAPMAQLLSDHGISAADAGRMTDDQWGQLAKAAGVNAPSKFSQAEALFQLKKLELTAKPSPALADALKKPGALAAAKAFADSQTQAQAGPLAQAGNFTDRLASGASALQDAQRAAQAEAQTALPEAPTATQPLPAQQANALVRATRETSPILKDGAPILDKRGNPRLTAGPLSLGEGVAIPPHIAAMKLPPALTDVMVDTDPEAELRAKGRDVKGRWQSFYSDAHNINAASDKFARVAQLGDQAPAIEAANNANIGHANPRIADAADAIRAVMDTGIRAGGEGGMGDVKSYGMATLEGRHVIADAAGNTRLQFVGKEGLNNDIGVRDPGVAEMLSRRAQASGPSGQLFPNVSSSQLAQYSHSLGAGEFSTKDFRTYVANKAARDAVANMAKPVGLKEFKAARQQVGIAVGKQLGHAEAGKGSMALNNYIDPSVFDPWR
jgi:DNA topoisomerase IB